MINDISWPLRPGMAVWPGDPPVELTPWASIDQAGYRLQVLRVGEHTGTHIGAPSHYVADGASLDQLDLGHFLGRALVVDGAAGGDPAGLAAAIAAIDPASCTHLLLDLGDADDPLDVDAPGLTDGTLGAACAALPQLRCIGTTRPNLDPGQGLAVGRSAAGRGLSHLESLRGLGAVPRGRLLDVFVGCPVTVGATGMPCRVLLRS